MSRISHLITRLSWKDAKPGFWLAVSVSRVSQYLRVMTAITDRLVDMPEVTARRSYMSRYHIVEQTYSSFFFPRSGAAHSSWVEPLPSLFATMYSNARQLVDYGLARCLSNSVYGWYSSPLLHFSPIPLDVYGHMMDTPGHDLIPFSFQ